MVPGVNTIGALSRLGPTPSLEKPRAPESSLFPEMAQNVSKEVEDEANSYFQRIYNHPPHPTLSIDEVLDMLKKFQDSPIKRERDVSTLIIKHSNTNFTKFTFQFPSKCETKIFD